MMDVQRISPRILSANLVLSRKMMTVISAYRPWSHENEEDKDSIYDDLNAEMHTKDGNCISLGDFIGHVESLIDGYE